MRIERAINPPSHAGRSRVPPSSYFKTTYKHLCLWQQSRGFCGPVDSDTCEADGQGGFWAAVIRRRRVNNAVQYRYRDRQSLVFRTTRPVWIARFTAKPIVSESLRALSLLYKTLHTVTDSLRLSLRPHTKIRAVWGFSLTVRRWYSLNLRRRMRPCIGAIRIVRQID